MEIPIILEQNTYGKIEYQKNYESVVVEGNLSAKEQFIFIAYCVEYGNYIQLELDLKKEGLTSIAGNGTEIPNPKYGMKTTAFAQMVRAAMQLGITPKTKLKSATKVKMSKLDSLRGGLKQL